jgi:membrane-bound lytic murein transglycosylase B
LADSAEAGAAARELVAERPATADDELAAAPPVATERVSYESARVLATVKGVDFPLVALDAYFRAAATSAEHDPACGVQWWAIAGISRVEGHHGSYGGAVLDDVGDSMPRIIGIQLNGTNQTQVVPDTDGGALDGDPAYDRAIGPMQFIPQTWATFAADGNDDGSATPFNLYDATLAAAHYLCRASGGLAAEPGLRAAYFSYNHSDAYVARVLTFARLYERSVDLTDTRD